MNEATSKRLHFYKMIVTILQ